MKTGTYEYAQVVDDTMHAVCDEHANADFDGDALYKLYFKEAPAALPPAGTAKEIQAAARAIMEATLKTAGFKPNDRG